MNKIHPRGSSKPLGWISYILSELTAAQAASEDDHHQQAGCNPDQSINPDIFRKSRAGQRRGGKRTDGAGGNGCNPSLR